MKKLNIRPLVLKNRKKARQLIFAIQEKAHYQLLDKLEGTAHQYHASMKDWGKFWKWFEQPENFDLKTNRMYTIRYQKDRAYASSQKRQKKRLGTKHFGGKGQESVYKTIINEQPPHRQYVETCGGMASVFRAKRSAEINLILELNTATLEKLEQIISYEFKCENVAMVEAWCALWFLENLRGSLSEYNTPDTLIYCDPPYLLETRTSNKRYTFEWTVEHHERFVAAVTHPDVKAMIQVTHYPCDFYNKALDGWRLVPYKSVARSGEQRDEMLYCNYEKPEFLHDSEYLGVDKRKREDISRRVKRNVRKLADTEGNERLRILEELWPQLTDYEKQKLTNNGINSGYGHEVF